MTRRESVTFGLLVFKDCQNDGFSQLENLGQDDQSSEDAPLLTMMTTNSYCLDD
jgi:hypothetical protein